MLTVLYSALASYLSRLNKQWRSLEKGTSSILGTDHGWQEAEKLKNICCPILGNWKSSVLRARTEKDTWVITGIYVQQMEAVNQVKDIGKLNVLPGMATRRRKAGKCLIWWLYLDYDGTGMKSTAWNSTQKCPALDLMLARQKERHRKGVGLGFFFVKVWQKDL